MSRCVQVSPPAAGRRPAPLAALQQYGSSEDSDCSDMEVDVERLAGKRRPAGAAPPPPSKRRRQPLPLPDAVQDMFGAAAAEVEDRPEAHQGRVRGFAHVRGNWATYVYVPFATSPVFESLLKSCLVICEPLVRLTAQEDFHVSLTRTVVLKHHWIQPFVQSVREALDSFGRVYVNDERTRTFLGLTVAAGAHAVADLSSRLDRCLAEYGLPPFYQEGSFHLSVAWACGDRRAALERLLPELDTAVAGYAAQSPLAWDVSGLVCRCGNRTFDVPLAGR